MEGTAARECATGASPTATPGERRVEALFRREYEPMHRLAYTLLRSDADAEEVVQEAFLAVIDHLDDIVNPGGYLRTTVVNAARKRLGRRPADVRYDDATAHGEDGSGAAPDYLLDVVDGLPERERTAVVLRYYACWNATEIGEVLGCPASTVRSILHRTLTHLRERLHDAR